MCDIFLIRYKLNWQVFWLFCQSAWNQKSIGGCNLREILVIWIHWIRSVCDRSYYSLRNWLNHSVIRRNHLWLGLLRSYLLLWLLISWLFSLWLLWSHLYYLLRLLWSDLYYLWNSLWLNLWLSRLNYHWLLWLYLWLYWLKYHWLLWLYLWLNRLNYSWLLSQSALTIGPTINQLSVIE